MNITQFYIAGINYKKTDTCIRGQFAVNNDQYISLLNKARTSGIQEMFILSTCNRTEIYGVAHSHRELVDLLCSETIGSSEKFKEFAYIKQGWEAIEHLFNVAAGIDSQILGDYEIVGQLKLASKIAKQHNFIGTFMERLLNVVLQSSKAIKSQTQLSGGTVSVSFAAVQFLCENLTDAKNKKIVLLGTGKIGRNTCKNLVDYLETTNITLLNRTEDKAAELAGELGLQHGSFAESKKLVDEADVVIVATNAEQPVIMKADLEKSAPKILIDLSIPNNIDPKAKDLSHVTLVNVDDLSRINDATLQMRMAEVPAAKAIIKEHIAEFEEWYIMRRNVPALKAVKQKLQDMQQCSMFLSVHTSNGNSKCANPDADAIQKVITTMAVKMRQQHQPGCYYIEAINDYIAVSVN
ncbi:glutamyl-tRNA reductase [Danxiaibacter flavus]|uniref:Glutamyl-tRNA reductase n=1 Tax=Danxiaibacter flavus TaxID=3049108 RepID=A0ABV3Z7N9_9BACT|nr:glutamyl-tRNA reductase [Chitinophagaceae bacterium DXS]